VFRQSTWPSSRPSREIIKSMKHILNILFGLALCSVFSVGCGRSNEPTVIRGDADELEALKAEEAEWEANKRNSANNEGGDF